MLGGGGGGSGMFLTPEKPITPQEAGMEAANQYLSGRRGFSPEKTQRVAGRASRAAQLAGRYGGLAAMLGAGVKNLYDQSASGEPLGLTSLGTSMYGAQQFARPLATRAGAQVGARVGVRDVQREARDARAAQRTGSPASADFSMPEGTDMSMFDMAQPTPARPTPLEQAGLGNIDPTMMSGDARAYGRSGVPSMSMFQFREHMPSFSPPPTQTSLSQFIPSPPIPEGTPEGMAGKLESALPTTLPNPIDASMEQMREQQKQEQEKKEEMDQKQLESLQENLKEKRDEQSTGA
jgi:hypothetical protein